MTHLRFLAKQLVHQRHVRIASSLAVELDGACSGLNTSTNFIITRTWGLNLLQFGTSLISEFDHTLN